jgi:hypothetical protein
MMTPRLQLRTQGVSRECEFWHEEEREVESEMQSHLNNAE